MFICPSLVANPEQDQPQDTHSHSQSITGKAPEYLQNLLAVCKPGRPGFRSASDTNLLVVPFARCKTFAEHSFSIQGPKLWNSVPDDLRSERDTDIFKRKLKNSLILPNTTNLIVLVKVKFYCP